MTMLDIFVSFARSLPADRLQSVEAELAAMMEAYSERYAFDASELAELDRRVAEPNPAFANPAEIAALLGKPFSE
jgi:hypothetical protein